MFLFVLLEVEKNNECLLLYSPLVLGFHLLMLDRCKYIYGLQFVLLSRSSELLIASLPYGFDQEVHANFLKNEVRTDS